MENKKGSGIFLGVVSVATLVVAIIGATFAYFSASASSEKEAIGATAYEFNVKVTNIKMIQPGNVDNLGGIIPMNVNTQVSGKGMLLYALNDATKKCVDTNNYQVCALYEATLSNGGSKDVTLNLAVKTDTNEAGSGGEVFSDLTFQALTENTGTYSLDGAAETLMKVAGQSVDIKNVSVTVPAKTTDYKHYFVVYLNEPRNEENTAEKDQSKQMGAKYTGSLIYTTSQGGNRLTGTFNVGV
ncbi:MAG: hypothetical protein SOZ11_02535 [Bacilli bacterium]|nr:hypothetical protein [Bacilli bacterium]